MRSGNVKKQKAKPGQLRPSSEQLKKEIKRLDRIRNAKNALWGAVRSLFLFAAAAVLVSMLLLPVFKVYKSSMTPTLQNGDILIFSKAGEIERGDIVSFRYNNQVLIKRVVAMAGEWITIDDDGIVSIDGDVLEEPYLEEFSLGECNIKMPFQVPDRQYFVLGDNRDTSLDSRLTEVGTIHKDQIAGKLLLKVWPL